MLIRGSELGMIQEFKDEMKKMFEMPNLGMMNYFLGIEVMQSNHGIFTCQKKYALDILKRFKMQDCKPVGTPMTTSIKLSKDDESEKVDEGLYRGLIGSLQYLIASRPDILFAVSILSRFMHSSRETHFIAAKRILRYIKGIIDLGIFCPRLSERTVELRGYTNSDLGGCVDDSRSISGYLFSLNSGVFTWSFKEARDNSSIHSRSRVHYCCLCCQPNNLVEENVKGFGT
jgi:hypothetical protein